MRMRLSYRAFSLAALMCGSALVVYLAMSPTIEAEDKPAKGADPQTFVETAAQDGMLEMELGKIAQQKSQNPDVQKFGARMVKDHGKANAELASIAKQKDLQVPSRLDPKHGKMVDELRGKSGADFDAAYSQHMVQDHGKAIDLFTQASEGDDPELAAFAKKTLPTLKEHKAMADSIAAETRTAAAPDDTPTRR